MCGDPSSTLELHLSAGSHIKSWKQLITVLMDKGITELIVNLARTTCLSLQKLIGVITLTFHKCLHMVRQRFVYGLCCWLAHGGSYR